MAPKIANVHHLDPRLKVESDFGLCNNGFLGGLLINVLWAIILISLDTNR